MRAKGMQTKGNSGDKIDGSMRGMLGWSGTRRTSAACLVVLALGLMPGGCFSETFQRGYVLPHDALQQIPLGATQEQVLLVLGTPSTVATVSGEAFYYISQRAKRSYSFMQPKVVDQRVIAVYFDRRRRVRRLAEYGLKDGKVFDFVSQTTPTGGSDLSLVTNMLRILANEVM